MANTPRLSRRFRVLSIATLTLAAIAAVIVVRFDEFTQQNQGVQIAGVSTVSPAFGWIPYWDQDAAVASFKSRPERFTHIGVFWHALLKNGSIGKYPYAKIDESLIRYAQARGIKVIGIVANLPTEDEGGDWDADRVSRVISITGARQKHIADIVALAKQHNFDGIHIDYEALSRKDRSNFTRFIQELSDALHKEGKTVSVALHTKVGEYNPRYSNGSQAQDWKQLARYADRLHLMLFEEHWETSEPGPAASPGWAEPIIRYAQKLIPAHKLYISLPLYGYDWSEEDEKAQGLTYADVQKMIRQHTPAVKWDPKASSHYFSYEEDGDRHEVWFEDRVSVQAKLQLYRKLGLTNFSFWRLGHEDSRVWELVPKKQ